MRLTGTYEYSMKFQEKILTNDFDYSKHLIYLTATRTDVSLSSSHILNTMSLTV